MTDPVNGSIAATAGAGAAGGALGGIVSIVIRPPQKLLKIAGQAVKDEQGSLVYQTDHAMALRVVFAASVLGAAGMFVVLKYLGLDWDPSSRFALSTIIGGPVVPLMSWILNTMELRKNTDAIASAIDLSSAIRRGPHATVHDPFRGQ
jgi:predicted DNA repair protein MutK